MKTNRKGELSDVTVIRVMPSTRYPTYTFARLGLFVEPTLGRQRPSVSRHDRPQVNSDCTDSRSCWDDIAPVAPEAVRNPHS